jgi:hypothetical protein
MHNDTASTMSSAAQASLQKLEERGSSLTLKDLRQIKTNLDRDIKYHVADKLASDQQKQLRVIRREVAKHIENYTRAADKVLGEGSTLVKALKETNKKYGHISAAYDVVEDQLNRNLKNQAFSLTDKIVGAGAMAGNLAAASTSGNPAHIVRSGLIGIATSVASKYGRKYAAPMAAKMAKRLGENLQKPAAFAKFGKPLLEAAKRSPQEFQALIQQFAQDPEFQKLSTAGVQ